MISLFILASHASGVPQEPAAQFAVAPEPDLLSPDSLAETPERRRQSTYTIPTQNIEWPYHSSRSFGEGFNVKTEIFLPTAMKRYTGEFKDEPVNLDVEHIREVVKSTSEYNEAMEATARVSGGSWTIKAKVSASVDREQSMSSKDVLFLLHTRSNGGFRGWDNVHTPRFTQRAKNKLCQNGTFTPEEFENAYGTHYVQGYNYASSMNLYVKVRTRASSSETKVSAELEASFQGVGKSVEGSATFAAKVTEEHSSSSVIVKAYAYGTAKNWVPNPDLNDLHAIIEDYERNSPDGAPVALYLQRYNEHRDYLKAKEDCANDWRPNPPDDLWESKLVNVVVEAKLLWIEVDNADEHQGDICARNMRDTAFDFYESLFETQPPVTREEYYDARDRMDELEEMWEECQIVAQPVLGGPNRPNARNLQACWGECDSDDQCAGDLKCFQRDGHFPIPGCQGLGEWDWDYCYDPSGSIELDSSIDVHDHPTGIKACHGDCDEDHQCAEGLVCFQRADGRANTIPGCTGEGKKGWDYCYNPNWGIPGPPLPAVETLGLNPTGLDICQGDCDSDRDCRGNLRCFIRSDDDWGQIPGCRGRGKKGWDYCYDPTGSIELSGGISARPWNLQACTGECNRDEQCASGLKCFQRHNGETIPGCIGSGGAANWDYCYDPEWQPNTSERRLEASLPAPEPKI